MSKILSYFALFGLISGLIVHVLAILGVNAGDKIPFIWLLHVGIFVVWFPVIFKLIGLQKNTPGYKESKHVFKMYKLLYDNSTKPLLLIAAFFFVYALINFTLFSQVSEGGGPSIVDGQYVLQNHGHIIKQLTYDEYQHYQANELRGFSGHWMAFYSLALAVLFPKNTFSHEN